MPNIPLTKTEALIKLQKYCAYQDRCHQEVRNKLLSLKFYGDELEEVMADLIADNFLNEERFACSYARGKFSQKKWGRYKIQQELKRRNVSAYCIKKAMAEIDEELYITTLHSVLEKKLRETKKENPYEQKQYLANYGIRRGYEADLVWKTIDELIKK